MKKKVLFSAVVLLAASSAVSSDLFGDRVAKTGDKKKAMNAARFTLLAIAEIAAFIARDPNIAVSGIVSYDLSHERGLKKESCGREIRYSVKK